MRPVGVQKVQADRRPNGAPPTSRGSESAFYSSGRWYPRQSPAGCNTPSTNLLNAPDDALTVSRSSMIL